MSIETTKLMNLADGKVLYDDLRQRIETHTVDTATLEEIQLIIDNYDEEEDEDMLFTANFVEDSGNSYFETEADASDIVNAFKQGKHVAIKVIADTGSEQYGICNDLYFVMTGYEEGYTHPSTSVEYRSCLYGSYSGTYIKTNVFEEPYPATSLGNLNNFYIAENGKIRIGIYID